MKHTKTQMGGGGGVLETPFNIMQSNATQPIKP